MTAQLDATLTTEISWKGQQVNLSELGIEQLDELIADIDYADFLLDSRERRGNISRPAYRRLLDSNDEVRKTVIAELVRRGYAICEDCHVLLSMPGSQVCPSCHDLIIYVD